LPDINKACLKVANLSQKKSMFKLNRSNAIINFADANMHFGNPVINTSGICGKLGV
jgi:hypothetical protein